MGKLKDLTKPRCFICGGRKGIVRPTTYEGYNLPLHEDCTKRGVTNSIITLFKEK